MKKLIGALLACCLAISLALPALAIEPAPPPDAEAPQAANSDTQPPDSTTDPGADIPPADGETAPAPEEEDEDDSRTRRSKTMNYIFIGIVVVYFLFRSRIHELIGGKRGDKRPPDDPVDEESLARLKQRYTGCSLDEVEEALRQWVGDLERAMCAGDMSPHQDKLTPRLLEEFQAQLEKLHRGDKRPCTEEMALQELVVEGWSLDEDEQAERLTVRMVVTKRTCIVHLHHPEVVVSGNPDALYTVGYRWNLTRPQLPQDTHRDLDWRLDSVDQLWQQVEAPKKKRGE